MENSPLSRLSGELRNHIYKQALHEKRGVAITRNFTTEPGLLQTCKQIRTEARHLFYSTNHFICATNLNDANIACLTRWLQQDPAEKLPLIKGLHIAISIPFFGRLDCDDRRLHVDGFHCAIVDQLARSTLLFGDRQMQQVVRFTANGYPDDLSGLDIAAEEDWLSKRHFRLATEALLQAAFPLRARLALRCNDVGQLADLVRKVVIARAEVSET